MEQKPAEVAAAPSNIEQIRIENQTFETQQQIKKVLLTEAGGESASDYESDHDENMPIASRKEGEMFGEYAYRKDRIFKYITIQDKNVKIPDLKDSNKLTLFMELDEVLLHTFICDENFGYIANPAAKDPEHEFFMEEIRQPVLVYMRDHWQEFVSYLKENEKYIDPVIYT